MIVAESSVILVLFQTNAAAVVGGLDHRSKYVVSICSLLPAFFSKLHTSEMYFLLLEGACM